MIRKGRVRTVQHRSEPGPCVSRHVVAHNKHRTTFNADKNEKGSSHEKWENALAGVSLRTAGDLSGACGESRRGRLCRGCRAFRRCRGHFRAPGLHPCRSVPAVGRQRLGDRSGASLRLNADRPDDKPAYLRQRVAAARPHWLPATVLCREVRERGFAGSERPSNLKPCFSRAGFTTLLNDLSKLACITRPCDVRANAPGAYGGRGGSRVERGDWRRGVQPRGDGSTHAIGLPGEEAPRRARPTSAA